MDLKTWFKGLGVFVASSLVTSVAASSLDPSAFNFSRDGLARMGALAALMGAKAVYLYMKQSPLPGTNVAVEQPAIEPSRAGLGRSWRAARDATRRLPGSATPMPRWQQAKR
jgi:hypothetical protein